MQKRTYYVLGFLIILLLGSSILLKAGSDVCPVQYPEVQTILESSQPEKIPVLENSATVPRNCVLVELFGGTW